LRSSDSYRSSPDRDRLSLDGNVSTASFCAHPGDSGGAVYNSSGALGIEITADEAHNELGTPGACSSSFIPIGLALQILREHNPSLTI
jgi:hypothetical protein